MDDSDDSEILSAPSRRSLTEPLDATAEDEIPSDRETPRVRIVVSVPALSQKKQQAYEEIYSDVVERVVSEVVGVEQKGVFYQVEFRDGRHDIVPFEELLSLENGSEALAAHQDGSASSSISHRGTKRRRLSSDTDITSEAGSSDDNKFLDNNKSSDEENDDLPRTRPVRRTLRVRQQPNILSDWIVREDSPKRKRPARTLRPRNITGLVPQGRARDDVDELAGDTPQPLASSDDDDDDFQIIRSDLNPGPTKGRLRKRSKRLRSKPTAPLPRSRGSSIEFENPRRSGRKTRTMKTMADPTDLDSFYVSDDKAPSAPKVTAIKEVFKPLPDDSKFAKFHMSTCDVCNHGQSLSRGSLVYCQGCTVTYHKMCIGIRQTREHMVTKVGADDFVLQCRFCIGRARAKDKAAPLQSMCQACRQVGPSCAPFSQKKTSRQEEAIRKENGGEDPITPVRTDLVNNADNVLFRCVGCRRPWHIEHLPTTRAADSDLKDVKDERLNEYSADFKCTDCSTMRSKIHALVAWRPTKTAPASNLTWSELSEDHKEYLIKWEGRSYYHCTWMPGAWVFGVASPIMRSAFGKRDAQNGLMRQNKEDAIPQEFLLADVILQVRYRKSAPRATSKEEDLARISHVAEIYVKFQGLAYEEVVWDSPPSEGSATYQAFEAAYIEYVNGVHFESEPSSKIRERVKQFKAKSFKEEVELEARPSGLRGKLMKYQLQGVNWMLHRYQQEQNAILADEMGLGKTVQVLALISTLVFENPRCWPFLVVVPNSTCQNWRREMKFWRPELRVVTYYGGRQSQELAYKHELFINGSKDLKAHVVVMSYDSAQDEKTRALFRSVSWAGLVVDEGQRLKNDKNLLYCALQAMHFPFRLLLTGTPLQNNKRELFNLLQFVDKNYDAVKLDEEFQTLTAEKVRELHGIISPYFYRRTKAGVLKFLPGMAQIIVPVTMTVLQEKLCKSIMAKNPELIRAIFAHGKLRLKDRGSLNNILMQLRKCLCHPFIYSEAIEERDVSPERMHRNLVEASGKLLLLEGMLAKLKEQGHRVLIFSQFLNQLDIVEDFLTGTGMSYRRLDGSMSGLEKQKRIDAYNAPGSDIFAFLLSTRAGGVGINLATADTVIIMDPDFNPHQDMQALSRAHRIGQANPVLCFQLMTRHSVEEKIMQVGKKKMALDHALIDRMDTDDAGEDLEGVLRHGAEALFSDSEKEVIRYDDAAIEKLLDRSQADKPNAEEVGEEQTGFSYGRIWSTEKGAPEENGLEDSDASGELHASVWDAILAEREAGAERERKMKEEVLGRGGRKRQTVNYRINAPQLFGLEAADLSDSDREENDKELSEDYSDRAEDDVSSKGNESSYSNSLSTPASSPRPRSTCPARSSPRRLFKKFRFNSDNLQKQTISIKSNPMSPRPSPRRASKPTPSYRTDAECRARSPSEPPETPRRPLAAEDPGNALPTPRT
ncbi:related to CHD1 - transcriptional regulator [Cephalotrichum gorgonifer]|uniref:Related to CHD1 - transcriptional regulator n=1 Tax=Cephalotrichum gorgonifer TaxID=2041049 RepID=A0AAE8SR69_9PEZI|nr:related to CHD1 - transcriptional regulator [Cephalotrichum gorgonifer]